MRKVSKQAFDSLLKGKPFCKDNTNVVIGSLTDGCDTIYLHGNPIVRVKPDGIYISTCGWNTTTTLDRLNAVPGVRVYRHKGRLYLNEEEWDGGWIKVDTSQEPVSFRLAGTFYHY